MSPVAGNSEMVRRRRRRRRRKRFVAPSPDATLSHLVKKSLARYYSLCIY
jgi:hypothetical protein